MQCHLKAGTEEKGAGDQRGGTALVTGSDVLGQNHCCHQGGDGCFNIKLPKGFWGSGMLRLNAAAAHGGLSAGGCCSIDLLFPRASGPGPRGPAGDGGAVHQVAHGLPTTGR